MKLGKSVGTALVLAGGLGALWYFTRKRGPQLTLIQGGLLTNTTAAPPLLCIDNCGDFQEYMPTPLPTGHVAKSTLTPPKFQVLSGTLPRWS